MWKFIWFYFRFFFFPPKKRSQTLTELELRRQRDRYKEERDIYYYSLCHASLLIKDRSGEECEHWEEVFVACLSVPLSRADLDNREALDRVRHELWCSGASLANHCKTADEKRAFLTRIYEK